MMNSLRLSVCALTFSCFTFADSAPEAKTITPTENPSAALEAIWAETNAHLDLTDEQAASILQSNFELQRAVLLKYGIDIESGKPPAKKLGYRKARAMGRELEAVRAETNQALENILTKEQMR